MYLKPGIKSACEDDSLFIIRRQTDRSSLFGQTDRAWLAVLDKVLDRLQLGGAEASATRCPDVPA